MEIEEVPDYMMDVEEAAKFLGLSKGTVYNKCSKNTLPHFKPKGGKTRFSRNELMSWLQSNARGRDSIEFVDERIGVVVEMLDEPEQGHFGKDGKTWIPDAPSVSDEKD